LTTPESEEQGKTAPIDLPPIPPAPPPSRARKSAAARPTDDPVSSAPPEPPALTPEEPPPAPPVEPPTEVTTTAVVEAPVVVRPANRLEQEVTFVPLAVTVGDGFKFGCGFFLAFVLAMLIGFVLFAALFVLTNLFGLNLPISR
jgi:hypothetical protein